MNSWRTTALVKLQPRRLAILRWLMDFLQKSLKREGRKFKRIRFSFLHKAAINTFARGLMTLVLVLSTTSCGDKAVSQEVSVGYKEKPQQISKQFSEVSPPEVIQELRSSLEGYQPQVTIITPQADEVLEDDKVTVRLQVNDLPIFKDPKLDLGPHLHVILDNEPYIAVYDVNQPLVLPGLSPGTHTLRVFASRPWHESFKNEGAYAQKTFHIFTKTEENNPDPALPLLTYSRPKGSYGAEPILLDFYLTNAPLHLVAKDNPDNQIADWRIRCTINGESFVFDRWQAVYLKGFKLGKNWVKLEFLDNQGNPVKNAFNSTIRLITYEPKGKDTLSKIVRGELSADQVRSIVDSNYTNKTPTAEPTPTPKVEKTPEAKVEEEEQPVRETKSQEAPSTDSSEPKQPEKPKSGGFFNRREFPTATPSPSLTPTVPEIIESPAPEIQPEVTPTPQSTTLPESQPEVTPTPQSTTLPEKVSPQPTKSRFGGFFNRRKFTNASPSPSLTPALPEIIESPAPELQPEVTPTPQSTTLPEKPEVTPTPQSTTLPEKIAPDPEKPELKRYFNPRQFPNASPSLNLPLNQPELEAPALDKG